MSLGNFYTPEEVRPLYGQIVPMYQAAFADEPWNEVSKCVDARLRCVGGLSSLAIGQLCDICGDCPSRQAYEAGELIERFETLSTTRPTAWYVERQQADLTLAAVAWRAYSNQIAIEKYQDIPFMKDWLIHMLGEDDVIWLDEVFANKVIRPKGNLRNFGEFVVGLAMMLDTARVAYRTIEPRMVTAATRDFGQRATVLRRNNDVPDRRDLIVINLEEKL